MGEGACLCGPCGRNQRGGDTEAQFQGPKIDIFLKLGVRNTLLFKGKIETKF